MAEIVLDRLRRKFGSAVVETSAELGNETIVVQRDALRDVAKFIRDDRELAFNMPIDCTAVDWLGKRDVRFEVVWHVYSTAHGHRLRIKVMVPEEDPACASLTPLWRGFNWFEREAWDMYGIRFAGHPNHKRILMYEEFVGFPLRKDYPIDGRQPLIEMHSVNAVPTQREATAAMLNKP